jgi:DNA mismatch repair ATPase MutL
MRGKISQLDQLTINSLHSDQIIRDLVSALKELMDNSIDAGASQIIINLKIAALTELEVTDNGVGIMFEDLDKLAKRGATSKLMIEDSTLSSASFLGFRV